MIKGARDKAASILQSGLKVAVGLTLGVVGICWGQVRDEFTNLDSRSSISEVLNKAQVSGSLAYWGRCDSRQPRPDLPEVRTHVRSWGGSPVLTLREMFADNPKMQVTQERDGMIRMFESDVPRDLLDVTISRISFRDEMGRDGVWSPIDARRIIEGAPEVRAFMRDHQIAWPSQVESTMGGHARPSPESPHVSGNLYNVTLVEAMNYVLKTFPGLWVYENCRSENASRIVFLEVFWIPTIARKSP